MSSFNELMQKYVNTDYPVLVDLGKEAIRHLMPACKAVDTEYNGYYMLTSMILSAVAADGVLSALERKMLRDIMDIDDSSIQKLISLYDSKMADLVNHFADNMGDELKANTIMLVTVFASADEKISREETAFIRRLFE